jgi:hypothetical protein
VRQPQLASATTGFPACAALTNPEIGLSSPVPTLVGL